MSEPHAPTGATRRRRSRLIAIIAGAAVLVTLAVFGVLRLVDSLDDQRRAVELCARWDADSGVLDEIVSVAPAADALWAAGGGATAERESVSTQLDDLGMRVGTITTSSGFPDDRRIWSRLAQIDSDLRGNYQGDGLASVVLGEPADSGGIGMDYADEGPSWVDGLGAGVAADAQGLEADVISFCATR
jgi:hypothetical protein